MTTRIALIDEALVQNGSSPLGSEMAPGAETHLAAFNNITELLLTCHDWTFATFIRELNRNTAPADMHWKYSYELPAEMIGSPDVYFDSRECRRPFSRFELFGEREVRTDAEQLFVKFKKNVAPAIWPGYFREVHRMLLRSDLALSIREDRVLRDRLREDAIGTPHQMMQGGLLGVARGLNDKAKPAGEVLQYENPLVDVRFS